ncbi:unnamed protein product [Orchesella dallaii]|uniref:F-box domain-containing protein n=1 Tax=Orchesella dallaii TaxID=48710 RepID=A0ABP1R948_9HEXA
MDTQSKKKTRSNRTSTAASYTKGKTRVWMLVSSTKLDDLQPELLEIIFSNLRDDYSYSKDLLTSRAVNQRWKSIIDGMMERTCRQNYLSLQPIYQLKKQLMYPIIPRIQTLQMHHTIGIDLSHSVCPKFIVSQGRRSPSNPFFSRSLAIIANNPLHYKCWTSTMDLCQEYSMSGCISNFGQNLRYLTITRLPYCFWWRFSICVVDLIHILSRTPNLKGFVLEDIEVIQSRPASRRRQVLPALPELTSLKIRQTGDRPEVTYRDLFDGLPFSSWLLSTYSKQLTCLEVPIVVYNALTLEAYPKLQELQFEKLDLMSLLPSEKLPLRRLIIKDVARVNDTPDPFMKLATFFHSFEDTLEHLELPSLSGFGDLQKHINLALKKAPPRNGRVSFPKLKVFGFPYTNESKELVLLKHYLLPKFMALETIEVMGSGLPSPVLSGSLSKEDRLINKFLVKERCWEVSRKLRTVRLFPDFVSDYTVFCVTDLKDDDVE